MADLNTSNFNALKPGILNVSTFDQPLSDGFPGDGSTRFVEDGNGILSGLKLGVEKAEVVDPTTINGITNVAYCNRTYARIADLKLLSTAFELNKAEANTNLTELINPITESINSLEVSTRNNSTSIDSLALNINAIIGSNVINRISAIESEAIRTEGGTIQGILSFGVEGGLNMGNNHITNLRYPTNTTDAVNQQFVLDQIDALRTELTALISP